MSPGHFAFVTWCAAFDSKAQSIDTTIEDVAEEEHYSAAWLDQPAWAKQVWEITANAIMNRGGK